MSGIRSMERTIARKLYDDFSKRWRREVRLTARAGQPGSRKPTFNQWYEIHQANIGMMKESTPEDVREYVQANDPWAEKLVSEPTELEMYERTDVKPEERGVVTINIAGDDE